MLPFHIIAQDFFVDGDVDDFGRSLPSARLIDCPRVRPEVHEPPREWDAGGDADGIDAVIKKQMD